MTVAGLGVALEIFDKIFSSLVRLFFSEQDTTSSHSLFVSSFLSGVIRRNES